MPVPACRNALAFGETHHDTAHPFIGTGDFALSNTTDQTQGDSSWSMFLFHWAFSAAAATIMAGAVAERMTLLVYLGYTCLMTTLVSVHGMHSNVSLFPTMYVRYTVGLWQV